jgi:hypothetical protein
VHTYNYSTQETETGPSEFKDSLFYKVRSYLKKQKPARCQWLISVILATQEAEIRRTMAQSQPWANSSQDPILKKYITKKWWSGSRCRP